MKNQIRLLILEDMAEDAELMVDTLKYHGLEFEFKVVETEINFRKELKEFEPDLVLSDYSLPMFTGLEALQIMKILAPSIPVIIVTGSINEETAVLCMKFGAVDYLLKANLKRIGVAVESALESKKLLEDKSKVEITLERAAKIINRSPAVAFRWKNEKNWPVEFVTDNSYQLFEYSTEEFYSGNINYLVLIYKDDIHRVSEEVAENTLRKNEMSYIHAPYRIVTKSGIIKWVSDITNTVLNKNGEISHFEGLIIDITRMKEFEGKLIESERFLNSIIDNIPNMVFVKDVEDLRFIRYNKAGSELIGVEQEDIIGKTDFDFFPKEEAEFFAAKDRAALVLKKLIDIPEESIFTKDKGKRILHTKKIPILDEDGNSKYLLGISEDITEKKRMDEALKESEKKFKIMATSTLDLIWSVNIEMKYTFVNDAVFELLGYNIDEFMQLNAKILTPPDDWHIFEANFKDGMRRGKAGEKFQKKVEIRRIRKDGRVIDVEITFNPTYDVNENHIGFHGRTTDITDKKRRQIELKEKSEELERFNKHLIGRENRMITLKMEVNELCKKLKLPIKYEAIDNIEESLSKM